jgi:hypothetical protein
MTKPISHYALTCEEAVRALKRVRLSTTAKSLAARQATSSRAVATALRAATEDGRVSVTYKRGLAYYRFVRLKSKPMT